MDSRSFRNGAFRWHRTLGAVLVFMLGANFLTGVLLLFSPELTVLPRPDLFISPPAGEARVSHGQIYDSILAADPDAKVTVITRAQRSWLGDVSYGRNGNNRAVTFWTRPDDGSVIGTASPRMSALRNAIRGFHVNYLVPLTVAHLAISVLSVFLTLMIATGLITYRRFWKGLARLPSAASEGRQRRGAWHRLFAVWTLPFLILVAASGLVFFLSDLGLAGDKPAPVKPAAREWVLPEGFDGADIDALSAIVADLHPGFETKVVVLPGKPEQAFEVIGQIAELGEVAGHVEVVLDPVDLSVLRETGSASEGTMAQLKRLAIVVHYANWGGFAVILIWAAFGVLAVGLVWQGLRLSFDRRRAARRRA